MGVVQASLSTKGCRQGRDELYGNTRSMLVQSLGERSTIEVRIMNALH